MTISLVANTDGAPGSGGGATGSLDSTGASLLILAVGGGFNGNDGTASDSKSNAWTELTKCSLSVSGFHHSQIIYVPNPASLGSGHTGSYIGGSTYPGIEFSAWSGVKTTSPFDQEGSGGEVLSGSSVSPGSVTPSENNELIIATLAYDGSITGLSINSGFTLLHNTPSNSGVTYGTAIAYKIQTSAAAVNPAFSWTNAVNAVATIATFKSAIVAANHANGMMGVAL